MISRQLQVFLRVADCGSFSKAAAQLFVTPASVMKQINILENMYGTELLKRSYRGIELTEAGKILYADGQKMLALSRETEAKIKNAGRQAGITIRLGSSLLCPSRLLLDVWAPLQQKYRQYKFRIVPFEDTKEEIISLIASLGERMDIIAGSFNSRTMLKYADPLQLGYSKFCIAVPKGHRLADRKLLEPEDLYGERLMLVKSGDAELIDRFYELMRQKHPQIQLEETSYYYDIDTFNVCEQTGTLLLTLDLWADIHPSLITLPVNWEYKIPYGILYPKNPTPELKEFIAILQQNIK